MKKYLLLFIIYSLLFSCRIEEKKINQKIGNLEITSLDLLNDKILFRTIAYGRESKAGAGDRQQITLTDNGFGHPSIIYTSSGFSGYKYWCALTPYFGVIAKQADWTAFENPHVFCSNDGVNWTEPSSIHNPLDLPNPPIPYLNYWSDVNLLLSKNKLYLYYRGNGFPRYYYGDSFNHYRATVVKESADGKNWSNRKLLFSTKTNGVDDNSIIASPAFIEDNDGYTCYDIVYSTTDHPIQPSGNQTTGFVMRRTDTAADGKFGDYSPEKICKFENRPWGEGNDPWHIDVCKYDGTYYMLVCAGLVGKSNGDSIYLAYSKDGVNFKVFNNAIFTNDTYKSALVPISSNADEVKFSLYRSVKSTGTIQLYQLSLRKV